MLVTQLRLTLSSKRTGNDATAFDLTYELGKTTWR